MADTKRMRVFAGPNGSGKTTLLNKLEDEFPSSFFGVIVNADDIESILIQTLQLDFRDFHLNLTNDDIRSHFETSTLSPVQHLDIDFISLLTITDNKLNEAVS